MTSSKQYTRNIEVQRRIDTKRVQVPVLKTPNPISMAIAMSVARKVKGKPIA